MSKKSKKIVNALVLIVIPVTLIFLYFLPMFPQISTSIYARTEVPSSGLFSDMRLELILEPSVEDLDLGYFTSQCTMNLFVEENATRETSFNIMIIPMGYESANYGVRVPFENLQHDAPSYSFNLLTHEWTTYDKYSHSANLRMPIASRFTEWFPADHCISSTIYVWFDGAFYPEITLSPSSSVPRGFILSLTQPRLVNATYFWQNILPLAHRLFGGKPSNDVLAFEIVIQRNWESMRLYLIYIGFLLFLTYEILAISRLGIKQPKDRLNIFVGLAIASIAFLWSIREVVVNVMTWSEVLLASIIVGWLLFEIKDALHKD